NAWVANENLAGPNAAYLNLTQSSPNLLTNVVGTVTFTVQTGLTGITVGQVINANWVVISQAATNTITHSGVNLGNISGTANGSVVSYTSGTGALVLTLVAGSVFNASSAISLNLVGGTHNGGVNWTITPGAVDNSIGTFQSAVGVYPANCDIWYTFKDSNNIFNPTTTFSSVFTTTTQA